jgi:transcription antitermination factor NusG
MERNWYIACTKKEQEQNVIALLTKKGIENYCPYTNKAIVKGATRIFVKKPIFSSFVFVYITADEMVMLKNIKNVTSTVYWKSKPAIIKLEEINAIKMLADTYSTITFEKNSICSDETVSVFEDNATHVSDTNYTLKPTVLSVKLPSLGYTLIAKSAKESETKATVISQKKYSLTFILSKRLNSFFMFWL